MKALIDKMTSYEVDCDRLDFKNTSDMRFSIVRDYVRGRERIEICGHECPYRTIGRLETVCSLFGIKLYPVFTNEGLADTGLAQEYGRLMQCVKAEVINLSEDKLNGCIG